ncbi:hypothetical protein TSUD_294900 [Trifolium subterraneum]|uniref:Reverse transcriptase domain-containing protein n=1 Tax=Trifolium subterraneum TaxID=3900 RepID=A0A2Z6NFX6_TRISU|nr:hypothetical protein TSUD_294900 [Trifolium subterraneum]
MRNSSLIYRSRKRNVHGYKYGFVIFSKVRDVTKLLQAINEISFGQFRIWARVARFDKARGSEKVTGGREKGGKDIGSNRGRQGREKLSKGDGENNVRKWSEGAVVGSKEVAVEGEKEKVDEGAGVRVGEVLVQVGDVTGREGEGVGTQTGKSVGKMLVRKYRSKATDLKWARLGVVATVFIHSLTVEDVMINFNMARQFFDQIFSSIVRWDKELLPFQRGAWVRLYCIPLHAWNVDFFKLSVMDCGRYLRADECTMERDRLDYARVLVATSSVEVINYTANILIDEVLVEIKFLEEWGLNLGEDACLVEEEVKQELMSEHVGEHVDHELSNHVDMLEENLADEIASVEDELHVNPDETLGDAGAVVRDSRGGTQVDPSVRHVDTIHAPRSSDTETIVLSTPVEKEGESRTHLSPVIMPSDGVRRLDGNESRRRQHSSCPPGKGCPVLSGPWCLEWFHEHIHGGAGIIFSPNKQAGKSESQPKVACREPKRKKVGGTRLGSDSSVASVNKDWENWVVMHGDEKVVAEDVRGIGEAIRVKFNGDSANMFSVLAKGARVKEGGSCSGWGGSRGAGQPHLLMIHGRFLRAQEEFFLFNVYAPCENNAKLELWNRLTGRLLQLGRKKVCICGDFNAVRSDAERRSLSQGLRSPDQASFNQFIDDNDLIDLPLYGHNFTWYRGDGLSMIRIDRFLLSEDWCLVWPNCVQHAQLRGLSDHCPLSLLVDEENWGPRPVVSEVQSAFVAERKILDGILVANEVVDDARRQRKELVLFKVDFEKAYDSVDWGYLDDVMRQITFPILWRKWIKECVSTATASVLVNGSPTNEFFLERGVGTGSSMDISHLQFADDTLILGVKSWANIRALRGILVLFESVSGVSFIYLGLPIGGDPRQVSFWEPVVNKIRSRLMTWKSRFLSFGGRLVLLKTGEKYSGFAGLMFVRGRSMAVWGYGEEAGRVLAGGRRGSSWWREIVRIRDGEGEEGGRVGLRKALKGRMSTIAEMSALGWGAGGAAWVWRRQLWAWEEELVEECRVLLSDVVLQDDATNYWMWRPDPGDGYSVRGAYDLLTSTGGQTEAASTNLIWHKQVPLKVSVVAWWFLRNRLPTKDNLVRRHIIPKVLICVWLVVEYRKQLNICFFPVLFSPPCGVYLEIGLESLQLIRPKYLTILFSLCILQEALLPAIPFCSYCGCAAFGWCGMNAILEFLRQRNRHFIRC